MLTLPDRRVRQRDFLLEISRAITAQLDLSEVLRRVLNASVAMLAGQAGLIALRNDDSTTFRIRAITGVDGERITDLNALLQELMASAEYGVDPKTLNHKLREIAAIISPELRQSIALPLVFADEPLGLLIVFRSYQTSASADDMQVLQSFADQAAIAVNNAQLYQHNIQERQRLSAILEYSADGIMILDADLTIISFNRALSRITGWTGETAVGLHQDDVIVWNRIEQTDLRDAINNGWPFRRADDAPLETLYVEGDLRRRDGMKLSVGITYAPLIDDDNHLTNIIANVRDITNFRRAQEMQNTFISTISHELRTPVALIKGYAGTIRRDDIELDPEVIRHSLEVIEEEADRLTELIGDLLTASKLQANRVIDLNIGDVRLDRLAERVVERFKTQTQRHRFVLSFPAEFDVVQADEVRLRQVLDNLISNAIKYSPDGGTIEIGGKLLDDQIVVFVRDEGVGIPEDDLHRVFDRFFRVDSNLSRKTSGTGLGLYLARAIIEAHNGHIHVESHLGHGSKFWFTIPR